MTKGNRSLHVKKPDALFDRVVSILEKARGNVVRAVNTNMVLAYWLIGREIVEEIQRGKGTGEVRRTGGGESVGAADGAIRQGVFRHQSMGFPAVLFDFFRAVSNSPPIGWGIFCCANSPPIG